MTLLSKLLDGSASLYALTVDGKGAVSYANPSLARALGLHRDALVGMSVSAILAEGHRDTVASWSVGDPLPDEAVPLALSTSGGQTLELRVLAERDGDDVVILGERQISELNEERAAEELVRMNNELAALARERARRERALERTERKTRQALIDLEESYWHLRKVQDILSFCMECGRVSADGEWHSFVDFLKENDILVSHAYCPTCATEFARRHGLDDGSTAGPEGVE